MSRYNELIITGNRGFLGMNFMEVLLQDGYEEFINRYNSVTLCDVGNLKDPYNTKVDPSFEWRSKRNYEIYKEFIEKYPNVTVRMFDGDISDLESVKEFFTDSWKEGAYSVLRDAFDTMPHGVNYTYDIINFASMEDADDTTSCYLNNIKIYPSLFEVCDIGVIRNVWHIGDSSEFGHSNDLKKIHKVSDEKTPQTQYGRSKVDQRNYLKTRQLIDEQLNVKYITTPTMYGEHQHPTRSFVRGVIKSAMLHCRVVTAQNMFSELGYVKDVVEEIYEQCVNPSDDDEIQLAAKSDCFISDTQFAEIILKELKRLDKVFSDVEVVEIEKSQITSGGRLSSKIKLPTTLKRGVKSVVKYYFDLESNYVEENPCNEIYFRYPTNSTHKL